MLVGIGQIVELSHQVGADFPDVVPAAARFINVFRGDLVLQCFGHCLITRESPSESIRNAGDRLGYVHIDDNHGEFDDHVALFDGVLKAPVINEFLETLVSLPYDGGIGIEFKLTTPSPMSAIVQARDFIRSWELRQGVTA